MSYYFLCWVVGGWVASLDACMSNQGISGACMGDKGIYCGPPACADKGSGVWFALVLMLPDTIFACSTS